MGQTRNYEADIIKLKALIAERFPDILLLTMDEEDCLHEEAAGYAIPKTWFSPPKIVINPNLLPDRHLETIAHEMGHHLDKLPFNGATARFFFYLGKDLAGFAPTTKHLLHRLGLWLIHRYGPVVFQEELRAWELGFQFLRDNDIKVDWQMEKQRRQGVDWYRRHLMIKEA